MLSPSCKPPFSQQLLHKHSVSDFFLPFFFLTFQNLSFVISWIFCCLLSSCLFRKCNTQHPWKPGPPYTPFLLGLENPFIWETFLLFQLSASRIRTTMFIRIYQWEGCYTPPISTLSKSAQAVFRIRNGRIKETFNTKKALALSAVTTEKKNWTCEIFWEWITLK